VEQFLKLNISMKKDQNYETGRRRRRRRRFVVPRTGAAA
jgi:hypothetical protein